MPRQLLKPLADVESVKLRLRDMREEGIIGDIVLWRIENLEIAPDDLKTLLTKRGIDHKWLPVAIKTKVAARKAVARVRSDLEEGNLKVLMRRVPTLDEDEIRYALIDEEADEAAAELDFDERNQVIFDKTSSKLSFKNGDIPEIVEKYEYYCKVYTQAEVHRMLHNIISSVGVSMNDGSGMYFIPVTYKDMTDSVQQLVNYDLINYGKCFFRPLGIADTEADKKEMGEVLLSNIKTELQTAEEYLDKVMSGEDVRMGSAKSALGKFRELQGKAIMYKDLLEMNLDDIDKVIGKAQDRLGKVLGADEDELEFG